MKEAIYYKRNMAIINYTKKYCVNAQELISSEGFQQFLDLFFNHLATHNLELYNWLFEGARISDVKVEIIKLLKLLLVLEPDEIIHPAMNDRGMLLALIEEGYNFWRNMERYSLIFTKNEEGLQIHNFIEADSEFNQLVLNFYRTIEQKVQGSNNKVYRQLQAGTNASILLQEYNWSVPKGYEALTKIPFINRIMLRTPLIIHPKSNKRIGMFTETKFNPINEFVRNDDEWICFPCKVGSMLTFAYFHRDFMSGAIAAPNLFEMASVHECENHKPDCIVLFGNPDGKNDTSFYYDEKEDIWIGKVSAADVIEYFGYVKKMFLTLHNLAVMKKGWLPIHGAMINLYLKNGQKKGIMFMGDSGSMFLGYIIAVIALLGFKNITLTSFIIPILLLAIPIMDTLFAILRRLINHKPLGEPDKNHLHHQLLRLRLSQKKTVLIIYLVDILFAVASILYAIGNRMLGTNKYGIIIYIILFVLTVILVLKTNIIWNHDKKDKEDKN